MVLHGGSGEVVKGDIELIKNSRNNTVIFINLILRAVSLFLGADSDGKAVFVGAADVDHVGAAHFFETGENIGGEVGAGDMAEMDGAIGIGEGAGDKDLFLGCGHGSARMVLIFV